MYVWAKRPGSALTIVFHLGPSHCIFCRMILSSSGAHACASSCGRWRALRSRLRCHTRTQSLAYGSQTIQGSSRYRDTWRSRSAALCAAGMRRHAFFASS